MDPGMATIRVQIRHFTNLKVPKAMLLCKDLVDITNVMIEELVRRRYGLQPAHWNLIFCNLLA
jgi:hypothetical protein